MARGDKVLSHVVFVGFKGFNNSKTLVVLLCVRSMSEVEIVEWEQDNPKDDDYKLVISTLLVGWFCCSYLYF
jgi:hypothetical protein